MRQAATWRKQTNTHKSSCVRAPTRFMVALHDFAVDPTSGDGITYITPICSENSFSQVVAGLGLAGIAADACFFLV